MRVYALDFRKLKYFYYLILIALLLIFTRSCLGENISFTSGPNLNGWTLLSQFSTPILSIDPGREHNLKMGVATINNQVLEPDSFFSFNQRSGPYTEELGWRKAKNSMVVGNELIDSIGGGVCQITATLYNAALLADLDIVERHPHNLAPKYVEPGQDAAVWYEGDLDLVFKSNKTFPIIVKAWVENKQVKVELWGKGNEAKKWKNIYKVELNLQKDGKIPYKQVEIKDENLPEGKKHVEIKGTNGYSKVTLRRIVIKGGEVEKDQLISVDKYAPLQERIKIGTNKSLEAMGRLWLLGKPILFREN